MSADEPTRTTVMAHPVAERLDALMAVLMAYIKDVCYVDGRCRKKAFYTCKSINIWTVTIFLSFCLYILLKCI